MRKGQRITNRSPRLESLEERILLSSAAKHPSSASTFHTNTYVAKLLPGNVVLPLDISGYQIEGGGGAELYPLPPTNDPAIGKVVFSIHGNEIKVTGTLAHISNVSAVTVHDLNYPAVFPLRGSTTSPATQPPALQPNSPPAAPNTTTTVTTNPVANSNLPMGASGEVDATTTQYASASTTVPTPVTTTTTTKYITYPLTAAFPTTTQTNNATMSQTSTQMTGKTSTSTTTQTNNTTTSQTSTQTISPPSTPTTQSSSSVRTQTTTQTSGSFSVPPSGQSNSTTTSQTTTQTPNTLSTQVIPVTTVTVSPGSSAETPATTSGTPLYYAANTVNSATLSNQSTQPGQIMSSNIGQTVETLLNPGNGGGPLPTAATFQTVIRPQYLQGPLSTRKGFAQFIADMKAGDLYVLVQTSNAYDPATGATIDGDYPNGELRGAIS